MVCLFRLFSRCNEVSNFFWSYLSRGGVDRPKNMSRIINSVHVKSFPIIIDSVHVKSFPVKSHPPNSCAFVFRQNFREGRQKRTAYFAPVGSSTPVLVPGIQWGDYSNSGIHLRYVNYGVQYSSFTRAFHCVTVVAEVAASSSKYARSGRKF